LGILKDRDINTLIAIELTDINHFSLYVAPVWLIFWQNVRGSTWCPIQPILLVFKLEYSINPRFVKAKLDFAQIYFTALYLK